MGPKAWAALALVALCGVSVQSMTIVDVIANNAPTGFGVQTVGMLAQNYISSAVNDTLMNLETGSIFIPSDAAWQRALRSQGFQMDDLVTDAVDELLMDHLIMAAQNPSMPVPIEGSDETKTYTTISGDHQLDLTFNSNGDLTNVLPSSEFDLRFGAAVNGSYMAGNVSVYYVSEVIITKGFYDKWIGNGAKNLAQALVEVDAEHDNILSILLNLATRRADLVNKLGVMKLNGTLFAPSNAAFEKLVTMVGFSQVDPESVIAELTLTEGLKELADAVLMYHFVPEGSYQPQDKGMVSQKYHDWNGTEFNTLLGTELGEEAIGNYTLHFMDDSMLKIQYGLNGQFETNVTEGFSDIKIITHNGYDWMSPVNSGNHYAHLHVINDVMLPVTNDVKLNLNGFDSSSAAPSGQTYNIFKTILNILKGSSVTSAAASTELLMDTPALRGALFAPSDAAIGRLLGELGISQSFLAANPGLLRDIIAGHIIFDEKMTGTGNYPTSSNFNYELKVTFDGTTGLPSKFERKDGGVAGLKNTSNVQGSYGPTAVGEVANLMGGMGNGYLHFVDEVIVPGSLVPRVQRLVNTPAGDAISDEAALVTDQNYTNTDVLVESVSGLKEVLNGNENFTVFWPSDEALEGLANVLDIGNDTDIFTLLQEKKDTIKSIMETYIVMESEYESAGSLQPDTTYETRAGTYIRWVKSSNTYIVGDTEAEVSSAASSRKLLSQHNTGSIGGSGALEGGGKPAFYTTSAAITSSQMTALESDDNAAASMLPSVGLLAAALVAMVGLSA